MSAAFRAMQWNRAKLVYDGILLAGVALYGKFIGFPFKALGLVALLILFLMAATSHDYWLVFLSPPVWKGNIVPHHNDPIKFWTGRLQSFPLFRFVQTTRHDVP
jgi:hypothetical protein